MMLRVVLNANIFVSALIQPRGPSGRIIKSFLEERTFILLVSKPILEEIRRSLKYPRVRSHISASDAEIEQWVVSLDNTATRVSGKLEINAVKADPDDDKYIAAAAEGLAEYIVTGDSHLLDIKEYESIKIVTPRRFLQILKG